jgi:hypothetical protein
MKQGTAALTIDRALAHPDLLGAALGDPASWQTWRVVLKAAFGLELSPEEARTFASVAGDRQPPGQRVRELWCVVSRRSGKSRMAAALAVYFALFVKHKLAPGERGMVVIVAASQDQARAVQGYTKGFLTESAALRQEIASTSKSEIRLRNGVIIAVHSSSFRTIRGRTLLACIFDEVAYWRSETSVQPDVETFTSVLPALATTNGMLVGISSPYRKVGLLYQKHRDHFGVDGDVLVVQGASTRFNPLLSEAMIAAQRAADPTAAASEWDAEFRLDVSAFLDDALIDAAVDGGRPLELPPQVGVEYLAVTDSSGGRGDAYTFAIGHKNGDQFIIDVLRGRSPPFDPTQVTKEYAKVAREYRISEVTRDHYAAEWVSAAWRDCGIRCERSELTKSAVYAECLPLFARGVVRLPDHPKLLHELRLLERHTHRSGKDTISHGSKTGSDDYANAACGVLHLLAVSGPSLWRAESFPVTTAAMPAVVGLIFATVVVGDAGQAGVGYFAKSRIPGQPLTILDVDLAPLSPELLQGIIKRLDDFGRGRTPWVVMAQTPVKAELERLGVMGIEPLDYTLSDPLLSVAAAVHVSAGRVQMCSEVHARGFPLGFLRGAAAADTHDPLTLAVLAAIVLSFDEGRTTTRPKVRTA